MPQEYISTSKKATNNMAGLLKPETVTFSSSAASSSGAVTSVQAVPAVPSVPAVPLVPADSSLQGFFYF